MDSFGYISALADSLGIGENSQAVEGHSTTSNDKGTILYNVASIDQIAALWSNDIDQGFSSSQTGGNSYSTKKAWSYLNTLQEVEVFYSWVDDPLLSMTEELSASKLTKTLVDEYPISLHGFIAFGLI